MCVNIIEQTHTYFINSYPKESPICKASQCWITSLGPSAQMSGLDVCISNKEKNCFQQISGIVPMYPERSRMEGWTPEAKAIYNGAQATQLTRVSSWLTSVKSANHPWGTILLLNYQLQRAEQHPVNVIQWGDFVPECGYYLDRNYRNPVFIL